MALVFKGETPIRKVLNGVGLVNIHANSPQVILEAAQKQGVECIVDDQGKEAKQKPAPAAANPATATT